MSEKNNIDTPRTNKAWGGRFEHGLDPIAAELSDSQHYDRKLYEQDIRCSLAHARMLYKQGIIACKDYSDICDGLNKIKLEIDSGRFEWKPELEDVHMNIEARLTELVGDAGKKLHTARSRNDQVATTFRLFVADCGFKWLWRCKMLCSTLCKIAVENQDVILPGCTHFQPAQPVALAHHMLAYASMFRRDFERLQDSLNRVLTLPLGAAALAGSTYPLEPLFILDELKFIRVADNSMDAVSDRDFVIEMLSAASLVMMHLSRLCEEIIIWSNPAFGFVQLPDEYSTGSSIMPQKKNPDIAELIRGKTGRVYGSLMAMLTVMKGLPLAYNRDMQEDKEGFFDTDITIRTCMKAMTGMLAKLRFNKENMSAACKKGFINATELADYLVSKNVPFRDAHHITGQTVALAEKLGKGLEDLILEEFRQIDPRIDKDVYPLLNYDACVARRINHGSTGPQSIKKQLDSFEKWQEDIEQRIFRGSTFYDD